MKMKANQALVPTIPTTGKDKLPKGFSYPLGAQAICDALAAIPQAENAKLSFSWRDEYWASEWQKRLTARGSITLFEISYSEYLGYWPFRVYSVPSQHTVFARELILTELQRIRSELIAAGIESRQYRTTLKLSLSEAEKAANRFSEPE